MTDSVVNRWIGVVAVALLVTALSPALAAAQDVDTVQVEVTRVQARGIYTSHDGRSGWASGDTLTVLMPDGGRLAARVVGRSSNSLLLAWIDSPPELESGQMLRLVGARRPGPEEVPAAEERPPDRGVPDRESIFDRPGRVDGQRGRGGGPRVDGRLMVTMSGLLSETTGRLTDNVSVSRRFLTPSSALRLRVARLPGDAEVTLNARYSRRFSSNDIIGQRDAPRIYDLSVSQPLGASGVRYAVGRFNESSLSQSGYWDGARMEHRTDGFEFGLAGGFEPDRYNQGFRSDRPKFAAWAGGTRRFEGGSFSVTGAFTQLRPTDDWLTHSFFSVDQDLRTRGFRLSNRLLVDRDPESGSWISSRYQVRADVPLTASLRLTARYAMRQPYGYWRTTEIFSDRREQITAGLSFTRERHRVAVSGTENRIEGGEPSRSASGHFSTEPSWMPFRTSGSLSGWFRKSSNTLYGTLGVHRELSGIDVGVTASSYRIETIGPATTSFMAGLSLRVPIHERGSLSIRSRSQFGGDVRSHQLYLSYWIAF